MLPRSAVEIQLLYFDMLHHLPAPQIWMIGINILLVITGTVGTLIYLEVLFCTFSDNWTFKASKKCVYFVSCLALFVLSLGTCFWVNKQLQLSFRHYLFHCFLITEPIAYYKCHRLLHLQQDASILGIFDIAIIIMDLWI